MTNEIDGIPSLLYLSVWSQLALLRYVTVALHFIATVPDVALHKPTGLRPEAKNCPIWAKSAVTRAQNSATTRPLRVTHRNLATQPGLPLRVTVATIH